MDADQREDFEVSPISMLMFPGNWTDIESNILLSTLERRIFWKMGGIDVQVIDQPERLGQSAGDMALAMTN